MGLSFNSKLKKISVRKGSWKSIFIDREVRQYADVRWQPDVITVFLSSTGIQATVLKQG